MPAFSLSGDLTLAQGSQAQLDYGFEQREGIPGTQRTFLRIQTESMLAQRPLEQNPNIDSSNLATEPFNLLVDSKGGKIKVAPDVNSILRMRVHHRGYADVSTPTAGVKQYVARSKEIADAAMPTYVDSLFFNLYRGDGAPQLITGGKCDDVDLKIVENKFADLEHTFQWGRDTHLGDPAPAGTNNAAFTGRVVVKGHRGDPESTDPLKVKCIDPGALDGTATVAFTRGATAYDPTKKFAVVAYREIEVILADGSAAGDEDNHEKVVVIFVPGAPGDTLTADDEWTIDPVRALAIPTYSTSQSLSAVGTERAVTLNGTTRTYALHNLSLKYSRPRKLNTGLGSKYTFGVIDDGQETCVVTLERDYTDRDFYLAVVGNRLAAFDVPVLGSRIGSTGQRETWHLMVDYAKVGGAGATVTTPKSLPEKIEVRAFRVGTTPLLRERIVCTIPTL
jgi:hypothetical protein